MSTESTASAEAAVAAAEVTAYSAASAVTVEEVAMGAADAFWGLPAAAARAAARGVSAPFGRTPALDRRGGRGAGALHPLARAPACPSQHNKCKCRRPSVAKALAAATVVVEVLVVSCGGGGYRVRVNQVLHGCPNRYVSRVAGTHRSEGREGGAVGGSARIGRDVGLRPGGVTAVLCARRGGRTPFFLPPRASLRSCRLTRSSLLFFFWGHLLPYPLPTLPSPSPPALHFSVPLLDFLSLALAIPVWSRCPSRAGAPPACLSAAPTSWA